MSCCITCNSYYQMTFLNPYISTCQISNLFYRGQWNVYGKYILVKLNKLNISPNSLLNISQIWSKGLGRIKERSLLVFRVSSSHPFSRKNVKLFQALSFRSPLFHQYVTIFFANSSVFWWIFKNRICRLFPFYIFLF